MDQPFHPLALVGGQRCASDSTKGVAQAHTTHDSSHEKNNAVQWWCMPTTRMPATIWVALTRPRPSQTSEIGSQARGFIVTFTLLNLETARGQLQRSHGGVQRSVWQLHQGQSDTAVTMTTHTHRFLALCSTLLLVAVVVMSQRTITTAATPSAPAYTKNGELILPADYRSWTFLTSNVAMSYPMKGMNMDDMPQTFGNVFVNPDALKGYE